MPVPAVTASPILAQGASDTSESTAAADAASATIMQNGAVNGRSGSSAFTMVPLTLGIQQVRSNTFIFLKLYSIEVSYLIVSI